MVAQPRKIRKRSNSMGEQLRSLIDLPDEAVTQNESNFFTEMVEDDSRADELHYEIEEQEGVVDDATVSETVEHQIEQIDQADMVEDCGDETVIYEIINDI